MKITKILCSRKSVITILLFVTNFLTMAGEPFVQTVTYEDDGNVFQYAVLFQELNLHTKANVVYYWHRNGQLRSTLSDYSGNILHGEYLKFDKAGRMLEKGNFYYGTKDGVWKSWNRTGNITSVAKWGKGFLKQKINYTDDGYISEHYRKNKLSGRRTTVQNKRKQAVEFYRHGIRVSKDKKPFMSIFKGKKSIQQPSGKDEN